MGRAAIVPHRVLDADHIQAGNTDEIATGLEARPATPGTSNAGGMDIVPIGVPDAAVDLDVYMRTAGNTDGARFGHRDDGDVRGYKGKTSHIPYDVEFLEYGTTSSTRPQRIKALPMASGELLLVVVRNNGTIVYYTWDETNGWSSATTITTGVTFAGAVMTADVVQMPDTGELILSVLGDDASNNIVMARMTSAGDTSSTIAWRSSATYFPRNSSGTLLTEPSGMAVEVLPSGRIAMLAHFRGTTVAGGNTVSRSFSDDRGVNWSQWETACSYPELAGEVPSLFGGVSMARTRTGSLIATVGVNTTDTGADPAPGYGTIEPSLICMVSDDGDTWGSILRHTSEDGSSLATANVFDHPIGEEGMVEAAVVVGDDGLPRIIGCLHGDSGGTTSTSYYDDFALLTLRKPDVSGSDVGPQIPEGVSLSGGGSINVRCTDTLETNRPGADGFPAPTLTQRTAHRICALNGTPSNELNGLGGSAPVYQGPRFVEAVNYRGAIWVFSSFEDTANTQYALGTFRQNAWSPLNERVADVTSAADVLLGYTYTEGWMAWTRPANAGVGAIGAGTDALDAATGGLLVTATGNQRYFSLGTPVGTRDRAAFVRMKVKPTSGGSTGADEIACQIRLQDSGAANYTDVSIRFTGTDIVIYDNVAAAAIVTAAGLSIASLGVEFVLAYSDYSTFIGAFYRPITTDQEDGDWDQIAVTNPTSAGAGSEFVIFGALDAASTSTATWYNVHIARGSAASPNDNGVDLDLFNGSKAWDAATPTFSEFVDDTIGYDDGLRHGTRAPVCSGSEMYLRDGLKAVWRGAMGSEGDTWDIVNGNQFGVERVRKIPVGDIWKSADDGTETSIVFDSGNDERWNPDAIAFFRTNLRKFQVQFNTTDAWGAPPVAIDVNVNAATYQRDLFNHNSNAVIEGADNREVRFTDTAQPMAPHQFRSDDKVTWYFYAANTDKSYKIIDNDGWTLFFEEDMTGTDTNAQYVFPDKIAINLTGGVLGSSGGYRYMRILMQTQDLPEGVHQIGLIVAGQKYDLTDPHPQWGWSVVNTSPVDQTELEGGGRYMRQRTDANLFSYSLGFNGMRGRPARATLGTNPGTRGGYMELLDFLKAIKRGERVVAFLPDYIDGRDTANVRRTHSVLPCRVGGPWVGGHNAYEVNTGTCGTDVEGGVRDILSMGDITFEEIL